MNKMNKKECVKELCEDQPCRSGGDYCVLKEIILHDAKYNERILCQVGCVNKFKYDESQRQGKDIGWNTAWQIWVSIGAAKIFSEFYSEDTTVNRIYKLINEKIRTSS